MNSIQTSEVDVLVKYGVFYVDSIGQKYLCDMGASSIHQLMKAIGFIVDKVFANYETELIVNGVKSSINDHIENGRLVEQELAKLAA